MCPHQHCARVREGGEVLQTIKLDRGCFACMLGGPEGRTLFIVANQWAGNAATAMASPARAGQVVAVEVDVPGAGWP